MREFLDLRQQGLLGRGVGGGGVSIGVGVGVGGGDIVQPAQAPADRNHPQPFSTLVRRLVKGYLHLRHINLWTF